MDLTRDLIMRAFQRLLQNDLPDAITYPQVAEAAGVSLRTVYRYFPTRVDLLKSAAAWLAEFTDGVEVGDPRTVDDLAGVVPEMGRIFDEHTNVFRALAGDELQDQRREASRRRWPTCPATCRRTRRGAPRQVLGYIRSGRAWLVLHDHYGLDGDEIVSALDWAATTLLEDVRRRNEAAGWRRRGRHLLQLDVLVDPLQPVLAPQAGALEAAERTADVEHGLVDPDVAGAHAPRHPTRALRVAAPDAAREAVGRVVGDRDRLVLAVVGDHRDDRAEDLLLRDRHAVVDVGEDRRLDEVAAFELARAAPSDDQPRALAPFPTRCSPRRARAAPR